MPIFTVEDVMEIIIVSMIGSLALIWIRHKIATKRLDDQSRELLIRQRRMIRSEELT